ncbi:hypothetical protein D9Q98_005598 [Chlorella vulgaris]|uniref:Uncharacterized protein n=1 Tax=Chlorella vulgaris TaxID=3077 RepID=A0A9D4TMD7_CHLVU|nr:hypothetical protein D9Q98_005598 [Chlorella vulgaris]
MDKKPRAHKKNTFSGGKRVPTSNVKASRLPGKQRRQATSAGGDDAGGKPKKKARSLLGLIATSAGFAALWAWNVWSRTQHVQADKRTLAAMRRLPLAITEHAACRMDCRFIGRTEIQQALQVGKINSRKSQPGLKPCPKLVVDAAVTPAVGKRKNVQCVFAACPTETRVITVIDTDRNWECGPC